MVTAPSRPSRAARSRRSPLHVPRHDDRAIAHAVLVLEGPLEDPGDDLHVAVAMGAEALTRLDAIVVDDTEGAKPHVLRVVIGGKREGVIRVEPAVVEMAALGRRTQNDHDDLIIAPRASTSRTSARAWMRSAASPATATRSAASPGATRPVSSSRPRAWAATEVAERIASRGDMPCLTMSSSSGRRLPCGLSGVPESAPAAMDTPACVARWKLAM